MGTLLLVIVLSTTVALGASSCVYTDLTGASVSTKTSTGLQLLKCASSQIDVVQQGLTRSFDILSCIDDEWYGTSCDGSAGSFGSDVTISCPVNPAVRTCGFRDAAQGKLPKSSIVGGAQVRTCAEGEMLSIEGVSSEFSVNRVGCMDNFWLAFNCDGAMVKVAAPLTATCEPVPTTTTAPPPTTVDPVLGELVQFYGSDPRCRGACEWRHYAGEAQYFYSDCSVDAFTPEIWSTWPNCGKIDGVQPPVQIEGVVAPPSHQSYRCIKLESGKIVWESSSRDATIKVDMTDVMPENPIARCGPNYKP